MEEKMTVDIVRAWKDPEYRGTLTKEELASLPPHPAGNEPLSDEELKKVAGAGPVTDASTTCFGCHDHID
jgi:mersacidin/lichenicidin family type 2 lantibiotic